MPELRDKTGTSRTDRVAEKRGPTIWLILSLGMILAIIGAAAALIIPRMIGDDDPSAPADAPAAAGPQGVDELFPAPPERDRLDRVMLVAGDEHLFGRTLDQRPAAVGDRDPSAAPGGLTLMKYLRSSAWVSATDGPTSIDERGVPHGFAHTPQGAALAGSWLFAYGSNLDTYAAAIDEGVLLSDEGVDPARRDQYKGQAALMPAPMRYKVQWDPRLTNVSMAFTTPEGKWFVGSVDVEWRDGDWAVRFESSEYATVATLGAGFVGWESGR